MGPEKEVKKKRGASRMAQLGHKMTRLWLRAEDHATIKEAARIKGQAMTRFFIERAICAAIIVISKSTHQQGHGEFVELALAPSKKDESL